MGAFALLSLPNELIVAILSVLDIRSLTRCAATCTHIANIVKESTFLVYLIQLEKCGMTHDVQSNTLHSELLSQLSQYQRAWDKLDLHVCEPFSIGTDCRAYELVGGTFSKSGGGDLMIAWLPTTPHEQPRVIRHSNIGFRLRDFAIDPTQDFVAMMELSLANPELQAQYRIHLRTATDNKPHPDAKVPVLKFAMSGGASFGSSASLQIAENILAIQLFVSENSPPGLLIWDWKDGVLIYDATADDELCNTSDFILLGPTSYLISSTQDSGTLSLYHFSRQAGPVRVATFLLPELDPNARLSIINSHSGPIHANAVPGLPFFHSSNQFIIVISIAYFTEANGQHHHLSLYVHNSFFQHYIRDHSMDSDDPGYSVPWKDWGFRNTRLMQRLVSGSWLRYVHGQRVVGCLQNLLILLDFGGTLLSDTRQTTLLSTPTRLDVPGLFKEVVETTLPFYVIERRLSTSYYSVMVDDRRIIGLVIDTLGVEDSMELHTYIVA